MTFRILLHLTSALILAVSCRKPKEKMELEKLPPKTQTGANTFGCLVNGQAFQPQGAQLSGGSLQCNYQLLSDNSYYFVLIGRYRNNSDGSGNTVGVYTDSLKLQEGLKFNFKSRRKGDPSASYSSYTSTSPYKSFLTDGDSYTGELWIKNLDTINQIISGTFWFDAVNLSGEKIEIREGRFDVRYTR